MTVDLSGLVRGLEWRSGGKGWHRADGIGCEYWIEDGEETDGPNADHAARVLAAIDTALIEELVGFARQVASYDPNKDHNYSRNDLIACEAVGIAESLLAKLKGGKDE